MGNIKIGQWIKSCTSLKSHPKLHKFCAITGIDKYSAIGVLQNVWWWALEYAEDGDFSRMKEMELEIYIGLPKDYLRGSLKGNLIDTGFIDESGLLHDWMDYAGDYLYAKYHTSHPDKFNNIVKKHGKTQTIKRKGSLKGSLKGSQEEIRRDKIRNRIKNRKSLFAYILKQYPNRIRSKDCKRHFDATVKTTQDWKDINMAIKKYLEHLKNENWKRPQNASTWFNNWKDWINYKELKKETVYYTPDGIPIR